MGASEAFTAGGWPAVVLILGGGVITYLLRKVDRLERRDEERTRAAIDLLTKREERDQERLRLFEERERRDQEARDR